MRFSLLALLVGLHTTVSLRVYTVQLSITDSTSDELFGHVSGIGAPLTQQSLCHFHIMAENI